MIFQDESPVFAVLSKPSMIDYPGFVAGVFFVAGCNFKCGFCHNPELMQKTGKNITWEKLNEICNRFTENWVDGAVITGGEPTISADLFKLTKFFRKYKWAVKLDTNGSRPDVLKTIMDHVNYVAMDVKISIDRYRELTGCSCGECITESIRLLKEEKVPYEFRTTVLAGFHDEATIRKMGELLVGARKWVLQPFVSRDNLPDPVFRKMAKTTYEEMEYFRRIASEYVLNVEVRTA